MNSGRYAEILHREENTDPLNYNNNGNIFKSKDRRGITLINSYNKSDLAVSISTGNIEIERLYSHLGPVFIKESENQAEIVRNEYEYHFTGGIIKNSQVTGTSVTHILESNYDDGGNQVSIRATGSGTGANAWSKTLNLDSQYHSSSDDQDPFNKTAILDGVTAKIINESSYAGILSKIKYGTTTSRDITFGYENFMRVKSMKSNSLASETEAPLNIDITRDFTGNILTRETDIYSYDGMNRLTSGEGEDFKYDEISNLLNRGNKSYEYQPAGEGTSQMRLKSFKVGTASPSVYTYDKNGNPTVVTGKFNSLIYDDFNRLREITRSDGKIDKYTYNAGGIRVKKEEDTAGSNVVLYSMYAGNNPVIEEKYDGESIIETRFNIISGSSIVAHIRKVYGTSEDYEYFYNDNLGSRRVVFDAAGAVTDKFTYSAYGEVTHDSGSNDYLASFTGKGYDATGLLYFNARYYDPVVGRFLTEDPSKDGINWYSYVGNNPVNLVDPTGLREAEHGTKSEDEDHGNDDSPKKDRGKGKDDDDDDSWWDRRKAFAKAMKVKKFYQQNGIILNRNDFASIQDFLGEFDTKYIKDINNFTGLITKGTTYHASGLISGSFEYGYAIEVKDGEIIATTKYKSFSYGVESNIAAEVGKTVTVVPGAKIDNLFGESYTGGLSAGYFGMNAGANVEAIPTKNNSELTGYSINYSGGLSVSPVDFSAMVNITW